ncbi:MAG TPA: magnesium and cobalt transport protein CorA [Verrucomicrobia bacterium]|nr:magnesium and cobalt transport protein CorA [Verrucomicrobiota bacterium]
MIRTFVFSQGKLINRDLSPDLLHVILYDDDVQLWVDMENSTPEENKSVLETVFNFHPLAIEDCVAITERPKIDDYENYIFFVVHAVDYINSLHVFQTTELNVFVGKNYLVTFHNDPLRSINATCERIQKKGHALPRWADLLAYQILDLLLDNYQPALDELSTELAALEHRVLIGETHDVVAEVVNLQTEVQRLRQIMSPQRDVIARMIHGEFPKVIRAHLIPYLRDLQDNLSRISDLADTYRETLGSTLQIHLNLQQMQINRVIKVLTILATLSMPILLVTSFYGMNIRHMPNTEWPSWPFAYAYILGLNALLIGILYWFMKRHKWL